MKILVADDDRVLVHLIAELLRREAHQVVPVFDAIQAFMLAMRPPLPDAVILDINMPGGTGLEVLKRLRSSRKTALIPVILLSGATNAGIRAKLAELGADAFLCKPVDPALLFETLGKVVHAA
jgi:DNA-binding response OmpR family regulator